MKKSLLLILSVICTSAYSQWTATSIFSTGDDCFYAFSEVLVSDIGSNNLQASSNEGSTFNPSNTGVPATGLHFGALNGTTLYAYFNNAIYQSATGNNWTLMTSAITSTEVIKSMAVIGGSVVAVACPQSGVSSKIYQLNGSSWAFKSNTNISGLLLTSLGNLNGNLWAGTTSTCVLKSIDAGMTFTNSSTGMPTAAFFDKYIYCLAASGSTLFAGTNGGNINRSTNGGTSWSVSKALGNGSSSFAISGLYYLAPNNILVATDSGFVYSKDNGNTWKIDNAGLSYSSGIIQDQLLKLAVTPNYIITCTKSGKVYRRPISDVISGISEVHYLDVKSKAYPNPGNSLVKIEASELRFEDNCMVKLSDMLGREVFASDMKNGETNIDLSVFNNGVYTYSIYHKNTVVGKGKLVVN